LRADQDPIVQSLLGKSSQKEVEINQLTLDIKSRTLQTKFRYHTIQNLLSTIRIDLLIALIAIVIFTLIEIISEQKYSQLFSINFGMGICIIGSILISFTRQFELEARRVILILNLMIILIAAFSSLIRKSDHSFVSVIVWMFTISNQNIGFRTLVLIWILQFIAILVMYQVMSNLATSSSSLNLRAACTHPSNQKAREATVRRGSSL
jgi:hypothetical protein